MNESHRIGKTVLGLALFLLAWELVAWVVASDQFPRLADIGRSLLALLRSGEVWEQLGLTWQRMLVGLAGSLVVGLALALLTARYAVVRRMLAPLVDILRTLPPPALAPLMIFVVGAGAGLFYFIVVFAATWPIYISASNALATAEPVQVATARSLGLNDTQILASVRIPAAMPEIMSGVRIGSAIALLATVATEMLIGGSGIGYMVYDAGFAMLMPKMYALMAIVGASGVALMAVVSFVERMLVGWHLRWAAMGEAA